MAEPIRVSVEGVEDEDARRLATVRAREAAVLELYRAGQISSGQAGRDLGMTRVEFLDLATRSGIPTIQTTPDETGRGNRIARGLTPVCNATPLIHLSRIEHLGLLRALYAAILVPNAVGDEVAHHVADELDAALAAGWLTRVTLSDLTRVDEIERELGGRGEAEVIGVALEIENAVVLIDETAARRYARARGLQVRGTLGVVIHAKRRGLIERATPSGRPEANRVLARRRHLPGSAKTRGRRVACTSRRRPQRRPFSAPLRAQTDLP